MNYPQVYNQLTDLPPTFLRSDPNFIAWINALTLAVSQGTTASDATMNQIIAIILAQDGWIDTWGLLFGIPRITNEANAHYAQRIAYTVLAGAGPPVAMALYVLIVWGLTITITEVLGTVGYTINFNQPLTNTQIAAVLASLVRIRPAGVPCLGYNPIGEGLYLDSINLLNAPSVEGAYIPNSTGETFLQLGIGPLTNNAVNLLPTWFLTDPILNGQVSLTTTTTA